MQVVLIITATIEGSDWPLGAVCQNILVAFDVQIVTLINTDQETAKS